MIRRAERQLTPQEIQVLTRPGALEPYAPASSAIGVFLTGIPALGCLGLVVALYFNRAGLPSQSRWLVTVFAALLAFIGLWLAQLAWSHLVRVFVRPRPSKPYMDADRASQTRAVEIQIRVQEAWKVEIGDDDVPSLLVRSGDQYVYIANQVLDDLWPDEERAPWESLPMELVCVLVDGDVLFVSATGPTVPLGSAAITDAPAGGGRAWWLQGFHELSGADLPPGLRAQVAPLP